MSIKIRIIVSILILVAITSTEFLLFMQGFLPGSHVHVVLKTPLYPMKTIYSASINVNLGRGMYEVIIDPSTKLTICIVSGNNTRILNVTEHTVIHVYSETGVSITVSALIKPYQTSIGSITVVRRWI